MNVILTLDYELYFGKNTGSVSKSITGATERLLSVLDQYKIKAVFFVDVGFIKKLKHFKEEYSELQNDYEIISQQLYKLSNEGHDLQLHIHPHWEDSYYENGQWFINTDRYKLSDWPETKIKAFVSDYKAILQKFSADNSVFVYRAGGWCIQPFLPIAKALKENNIWLDSTVFRGGYNDTDVQSFDFRNIPDELEWNFETDPLEEEKDGFFLEVPISSYRVSPIFFWKLAFTKILNKKEHQVLGDGQPMPASKFWLLKKLIYPSYSTVSIDGFKASFLEKSFLKQQKKNSNGTFVIIGHPKALTNYSLSKLRDFFDKHVSENNFSTFSELYHK